MRENNLDRKKVPTLHPKNIQGLKNNHRMERQGFFQKPSVVLRLELQPPKPGIHILFLRLKKFLKGKKRRSTFALEVDDDLFDKIEEKILDARLLNKDIF